MPESLVSIPSEVWLWIKQAFLFILSGFLGILGFNVRRQIKRMDELDQGAVRRHELAELKKELREGFHSLHERIDRLYRGER